MYKSSRSLREGGVDDGEELVSDLDFSKNVRNGEQETMRASRSDRLTRYTNRLLIVLGVSGLIELISGIIIVALAAAKDTTVSIGVIYSFDEAQNPLFHLNTSGLLPANEIVLINKSPNVRFAYMDNTNEIPVALLGGLALIWSGLVNMYRFVRSEEFKNDHISERSNRSWSWLQKLPVVILLIIQLALVVKIADGLTIFLLGFIVYLSSELNGASESEKGTSIILATGIWSRGIRWILNSKLSILVVYLVLFWHAIWHTHNVSLPYYVWIVLVLSVLFQFTFFCLQILYISDLIEFMTKSSISTVLSTLSLLLQGWIVFGFASSNEA